MKKIFVKKTEKFFSILLAAGLLFGTAGSAKTNKEYKDEINALNGRVSQITKEQTELKNRLAANREQTSTLTSELNALTTEIDYIDEQIFVIDNILDEYSQLIEQQKAQITELDGEIVRQKKMLDDMIRMSYEYGDVGNAVEFIFSAEDFSDLLMRLDMLGYHLSYNTSVLDKYQQTVETLEQTKADYEAALVEMQNYKNEQEALKAQLAARQAEAQAKRAALEQDAALMNEQLSEKQAAIAKVDSEIKNLAALLAKQEEEQRRQQESGGTQTVGTSDFQYPLPSGVGIISSYYGYRKDPFTGKTAYHNGYDLACGKGTKIYAAADGKVMTAGYNENGYGNYIIISHAGGLMSLYGHCSSLAVVAGQQVKRGDVIGYVGSTGRSTGNHLHFTMYKDGAVIDPAPYIGL